MKIIADIGSNWHSLDDCIESIETLGRMKVDYAKFQFYTYEKLYGKPGSLTHELPSDWLKTLKRCCDDNDIGFMCSVFDDDDVAVVDPLVDIHKVASAEVSHMPLLKKLQRTGKDVLVSTGCASVDDLDRAYVTLGEYFIPMACTMDYPATEQPILQSIWLTDKYGQDCWIGYSDHTLDTYAGMFHATLLCEYYERHFSLDRITGTPDKKHSITETQFKDMMRFKLKHIDTGNMGFKWKERQHIAKRVKTKLGFFRPEPE